MTIRAAENPQPGMTKSQIARVLAKAAAFDKRTIGEADVEAWHECIGYLPFDPTMSAVTTWYRVNDQPVMPANLIRIVTEDDIPDCWR